MIETQKVSPNDRKLYTQNECMALELSSYGKLFLEKEQYTGRL